MTEPIPIRATERQRITRPHEVIETERVVEFATPTPAPGQGLALPSAEKPACDCGLCQSPLHLARTAPARRALPPAPPAPPAPAPWWRRWLA